MQRPLFFMSVCKHVCTRVCACVFMRMHLCSHWWGQPFYPRLSVLSARVFVCFCILRRDYFS